MVKLGDYSGITDIDTLVAMVRDENLDTQKRVMAVFDIGLDYDFDWHCFLDFVVDKSQPSAIRAEIFDKQSWHTRRAMPVILEALQEDNDEIQFWAAFALITHRWEWESSEIDLIIEQTNKVADNDNIAPNMWHVGREALYALECAYYSKINSSSFDKWVGIISPCWEYGDLWTAKNRKQIIPKSNLRIEPDWLQQKIQSRFKSVKFNLRRPKPSAYLLNWQIGYGKNPLCGALHQDGFGIVLTGLETSVRRFAKWYRTIISDDHELRLYEWADEGEVL